MIERMLSISPLSHFAPTRRASSRGNLCRRQCTAVLCSVALLLAAGCSTIVIPPAHPKNPRPVFLLEHGQHASLVLPGKEQGIVRYSYGDWRYYALGEKGIGTGLNALAGPTLSGLGRRELRKPATAEGVRESVLVPIANLHKLIVESSAVETLREMLDDIYRTNLSTLIYNPEIDMEFVHHPVPYSAGHNSNKVVADWLQVLGCEVLGPTFVPNWSVRPARQ
jgi:hypothetical protein